VQTAEQLEDALTAQAAMVYVMSSPEAAKGPLSIANICRIAKAKGHAPCFVGIAAAEEPLSPNKTSIIQAGAIAGGATSGGKCMARGRRLPAVLFLGDPALIRAGMVFRLRLTIITGRGYKVGKEEIMGMLAACGASGTSGTTRRSGRSCRAGSTRSPIG